MKAITTLPILFGCQMAFIAGGKENPLTQIPEASKNKVWLNHRFVKAS